VETNSPAVQPDLAEIKKAIEILFEPEQVVELRAVETDGLGTVSGYFKDFAKLESEAHHWAKNPKIHNLYWTLNPAKEELHARCADRTKTWAKDLTTDQHTERRMWLLIDCDPRRVKGISSTDEEKAWSKEVWTAVIEYLRSRGFKEPVLADSGNGYHGLYRIDLPNDPQSTQLLKSTLEILDKKFSTGNVAIDTTVFNASRIFKVYGSVARKGDSTPERPHRLARILAVPEVDPWNDPVETTPREVIEQLVADEASCLAQSSASASVSSAVSSSPFSSASSKSSSLPEKMAEFLTWGGFTFKKFEYNGGWKFVLNHCEFNVDHNGTEVAVILVDKMGYKCQHASCSDKHWSDFRAAVEKRMGRKFWFVDKPSVPQNDQTAQPKPYSQNGTVSYSAVSGTAADITPKKIKWLWPNRFAQKLNLLVGNPDKGKGLIAYYSIAQVTTGRDWYDAKNEMPAAEALIMSGEEDWDDTVVPRLIAAGADLTKVRWLKMSAVKANGDKAERELQLDRDMGELEKFLVEHPDIRLVVIDPISNYLGRVKMVDEQWVRELLTPLKELSNKFGVAIIGIMHLNKKVDLDAIHRIGGAMAFVGVARMVWLCAPRVAEDGTETEERVMVKVKGNIVQHNLKGLSYLTKARTVPIEGEQVFTPYVEWTGDVDQQANELTQGAKKNGNVGRPAEQLSTVVAWLREYLCDGPKTFGDIDHVGHKKEGFSLRTLERARGDEDSFIKFVHGQDKARDGKMRDAYSCRLTDQAKAELDAARVNI
jgi:hypothetical protein